MAVNHHQDTVRAVPGGGGEASVSVDFKRLVDDTAIGSSATSDADGLFTKSLDDTVTTGQTSYELHPGPYYTTFSHNGTIRVHASTSFGSAGPVAIGLLPYVLKALGNGVIDEPVGGLNEFAVTTDGSGRDVDVATGAAVVEGVPLVNDASRNIALSANASGSARVDAIVLDVEPPGQTEEGKVSLGVVEGTPGAGNPSLTQTTAQWQFPLAYVTVADGASVINTADIADARQFVLLTFTTTGAFKVAIDGGGTAYTTGVKADFSVPFACTVTDWRLLHDQASTTTLDVWADTFANFPPTVADTITGTEQPATSAAASAEDTSLTTWTTALAEGDVLRVNVDANDLATRSELTIFYQRSVS